MPLPDPAQHDAKGWLRVLIRVEKEPFYALQGWVQPSTM